MTEHELLEKITALCQELGLLWHHCEDSRYCGGEGGFPDLFIVGTNGFLLWELKGQNGETSAEQDAWLWTLRAAGVRADVITPDLWETEIQLMLEDIM